MSMVNFSCCVDSASLSGASRDPKSNPSADACGRSNGSWGMLVFDQPIDQGKPGTRASDARVVRLRRAGAVPPVVAAQDHDRRGRAGLRDCRRHHRQEPDSPKFTATAQLYVDPRELQLVDRELTPRAQDVSGLSMVVESQARLITSNSVLLKVIQEHQSRQGSRIRRRRRQGTAGVAARPVRDRAARSPPRPKVDHTRRARRAEPAHHRSARPRRASSSTSRSGRTIRPRRRCSPTRSPTPISPNPRARRRPPRGAPPAICPAG